MNRTNNSLIMILIFCVSLMGQEAENAEFRDFTPTSTNNITESERKQIEDKTKSQKDSEIEEPGLKEFLRDTTLHFGFLWAGRLFYVRNKDDRIFDTSFSQWLDNISGITGIDDGDGFATNFVYHPLFGAE